jgi:hypothetical protein
MKLIGEFLLSKRILPKIPRLLLGSEMVSDLYAIKPMQN